MRAIANDAVYDLTICFDASVRADYGVCNLRIGADASVARNDGTLDVRFFADGNAGEYRTVRADDDFTSEFDVRGDEVFVSRGRFSAD